jgi:hypothetical protein
MKSIYSLFSLFFFLIGLNSIAQKNIDVLHGRIITREGSREGIVVTNTTKENSVISDKMGYFDISSQVNDTLKFTSPFHIEYTYVVTELDIMRNPVLFPLEQLYGMNQLNEIVITKYSGGSLGLFDGIGKKYTPAERKLKTANSGLDLVVNALSGRTGMLRKNLAYEREDLRVDKFFDVISNERLTAYYKVPADYTESFVYFAVTNKEVKDILDSTGIVSAKALEQAIIPLVFEFLEMINIPAIGENLSKKG